MRTFLLTWNPGRWPWDNLATVCQKTAEGAPYESDWSTGNSKKIARGDRVFLLKQGEEPRGIIAAGWVTSEEVYDAPHYDEQRAADGETALHADVKFERIVDPAENTPLSVEGIKEGPLARVYWRIPASGTELPEDAARQLENLWAGYLEGIDGPAYLVANDADEEVQEAGFSLEDVDLRAVVFRQIKARRGQQAFRDSLRERYGDQCMISGCTLMDVVEAAHIKPYRGDGDNHPANGLLLRADLHTLFDLDLIGIEPESLMVRVHPDAEPTGYGGFGGLRVKCSTSKPSPEAVALRWDSFLERTGRRWDWRTSTDAKGRPEPKRKPASPAAEVDPGLRPLRALSIRQPHAEAIMRGVKKIEYRSGPTKIRGDIYIYASLGRYSADEEAGMLADYGIDDVACDDLPRGVLVGTVELFDCDGGQWHVRNPARLKKPPKPTRHPQPVWFHPF